MIKIPAYLQQGDTIGIVCPAGYMDAGNVQTCIETLQSWGYRVITGNTVGGNSANYFSGTDEERLNDLQQMLDNKEVKAVLCGRGGYGVSRIVDKLDFKQFRKNPKWIIGFSDITVLHTHIHSNFKIATLHAPMAAAFNDEGYKNTYIASLKAALEGKRIDYEYAVHSLNRNGKANGILIGGNLTMLLHVCGTASDVSTKDKILFIEDVGEYLYNIDRLLLQLKRNGKLKQLAGLIVGTFSDCKDTTRPFGKDVYEIIKDAVKEYDYPVCFGFPVGHTTENSALKSGMAYFLKVGKNKVELQENK